MFRILGVAICVIAFSIGGVSAGVSDYYNLKKPSGAGPYPAVLLVPGCSGFTNASRSFYGDYGNKLVAAGFVVIEIDYLRPRNLVNCITLDGTKFFLGLTDVAADIAQGIGDLEKNPIVDRTRINLLGFSFGGGGVLEAMANPSTKAKLHSVVAYYPLCVNLDPWDGTVRSLLLVGGQDKVAPPELCRAVAGKAANQGNTKIVEFADAYHAFDAFALPPQGIRLGPGMMIYNANDAANAWNMALPFLKQ